MSRITTRCPKCQAHGRLRESHLGKRVRCPKCGTRFDAPPAEPPPATFVNPTDGSEMILIPGGEFLMGSPDGQGYEAEYPQHSLRVESFYLGKYEITNAQWKRFVDAHLEWGKDQIKKEHHDGTYLKDWEGNSPPAGKEHYPVVYVSWYAAVAYCEWAGLRLPTEAEWEYAAQGEKGCEYGTATGEISPELANYGKNVGGTTKVGRYPANPWGIYDLSGNVREWCSSEYKSYPYRADDGREDLQTNVFRVVRGGSWISFDVSTTRARHRDGDAPAFTNDTLGLRCARSPRP
jgi:predicted Zn finger-like uncharacterized protein